MLQLIKFHFAYPGQSMLLNSTSLNINKGEKIALLGYNGVGKSSIIKSIWEKFIINDGSVIASNNFAYLPQNIPDIEFDTQDIKSYPDYYQLFYMWQSTENMSKSQHENFDDSLFYWSINALPDKKFIQRLENNLFELKISSGLISSHFKHLSPGTKKKILLAILFATNPDVIIVDELTNHLDKDSIKTVSNWMKDYSGSVLIVDHNNEFLEYNINNFLFLPNNEKREFEKYYNVSFTSFMESLNDKIEREKTEVKHVLKREKSLKSQLKHLQFRAEVFDADIGASARSIKKKLINEVENNEVFKNQDLRKEVKFGTILDNSKIKKSNLITIKDLKYSIGEKTIQSVEEFKLYQGQRIWLKGENGRGKSSLLNIIKNKVDQELQNNSQYISGEINLNINHDGYFILEQNTVYGEGMTIIDYTLRSFKLEWFQINSILKKIGLGDKFDFESNISHLSLGELIRYQLALVSANINGIKLIILDEPGNFLDIFTQKALIELFNNYKGALLYITHDEILGQKFNPDLEFVLQ